MIKSIRNQGLKLLFEDDNESKLSYSQFKKDRILLQVIDELEDVLKDLEGYVYLRPQPLAGNFKGYWSLDVTGNYRIIFRFVDGDAYDVDYFEMH